MNYTKYFTDNAYSLKGKTIAVSGSTGGLGMALCDHLAALGADLVLLNRSIQRSEEHEKLLKNNHQNMKITLITVDFEDGHSVKRAVDALKLIKPNALIINAGAYSIPRHTCESGYDNVFEINFASPYYMVNELLPTLREVGGSVIAVGSIAHNYSKTDVSDVDFSTRRKASLVYGNAKRYLMFSLYELFKDEENVSLSIVHPGITFTNITSHYPKFIFSVIKHPMKVIFMKPAKAALSIIKGLFDSTPYHTWIGPRVLNVWGLPKKKVLRTCSIEESKRIAETAEDVYKSHLKIFGG